MDKPTRNIDLIDRLLADLGMNEVRPDEFLLEDYWERMKLKVPGISRKTAANHLGNLARKGVIVARSLVVNGHRTKAYSEKKP